MIEEYVAGSDLLIRAGANEVADALASPLMIARWAGGLHLRCYADRGDSGQRHVVTGVLVGTCEWWLEPWHDMDRWHGRAMVVHFWLRGRPTRDGDHLPVRSGPFAGLTRRRGRLVVEERLRRWRRAVTWLRPRLERAGAGWPDA